MRVKSRTGTSFRELELSGLLHRVLLLWYHGTVSDTHDTGYPTGSGSKSVTYFNYCISISLLDLGRYFVYIHSGIM